jgi:hypothetical protein
MADNSKRDVKTVQLEPYLHELLKQLARKDHRNIKNYLTVLILADAEKNGIVIDEEKLEK